VRVPKTAIDENYLLAGRENKIRPPGQILTVQTVTSSKAINDLPNDHFGLGVPAVNLTHYATTLLRTKGIHTNKFELDSGEAILDVLRVATREPQTRSAEYFTPSRVLKTLDKQS